MTTPWTVGAVAGGIAVAGFLWWALADLFLAAFELPFAELADQWRRRLGGRRNGSAENGAAA